MSKKDRILERLVLGDNRRYDYYYSSGVPSFRTAVKAIAAIVLTTAGIIYYYTTHPFVTYTQCSYKLKEGDTIAEILKDEGLSGEKLQEGIDYVCSTNSEAFSRGGSPIRRRDQEGNIDCNYWGLSGVVIKVPDVNKDGKINGKTCPESREPR
ncbi:MAG: hypothetical protein KJ574_05135 [Nanoarchaeota archaeon]|nr:hypothetical protein [Nanoarchaeota archaeon]